MKQIYRQAIYPKDVQLFTGKSLVTAYRMVNRARKALNKPARSLLSVAEFCRVMQIREEEMEVIITGKAK